MQSKLKVTSRPEAGSEFYFDLLLKEVFGANQEASNLENSSSMGDTSALKIKILIAEDNAINMLLVKTILKSLFPNVQLIESKNGKEAIEKFIQEQPDMILMDVQMPLLNGLEATKQIRILEKNGNTPIIAITAGTLKEERELCFSSGMNDFVSKPIVKEIRLFA